MPSLFRCGKASYWHGIKGWWADRGNGEDMGGPFRGPRIAQAWAEGPLRAEFERQEQVREEKRQTRQAAQEQREEAKARRTWGDAPADARGLSVGQIWAMKQEAFKGRQVLILEIRKTSVVVLTRAQPKERWKHANRDVREARGLLRVYRLVGTGKIPKVPASRRAG